MIQIQQLQLSHSRHLLPLAILVVLALSVAGCANISVGAAPTSSPTQPAQSAPTATSQARPSSPGPVVSLELAREEAIKIAEPAVVKVDVGSGLGSGVILDKRGYIITNNHVVVNAQQLAVTLPDGRRFDATLTGQDPIDDLAVIKISGTNLPTVQLGNSADLVVGQSVLAIGNPLGITRTVTEGIVSALGRTVSEGRGGAAIPNAIQTSAAINPGNSGGALINLAGQVIGIPTLTAIDPQFNTPASGVGFAIPSNTVKRIFPQLISTGGVVHTGRAALGIVTIAVDQNVQAQNNLPVDHGMLIVRFAPNSAAQKAGLQVGDVIVAANNQAVNGQSDLLDQIGSKSPGDKFPVTVVSSKGSKKTVTVTLGELSASA